MNSRRNSLEDDLRKQLLQEQRDKMVLLDQLAMVKVSICFHCQNDLPPMETRLQQTLERRAAKLNKLREKLIRVSHDLRTEECVLENAKEELHVLKKESGKARHLIEQEQLLARELKLTLDEVVQEKRALMARKEIELECTKESKSEIEHLQTSNYASQVQCDLLCTSEAVSEMQEQLRLLVDMKKNLDTEIYTINEYLILKRQELEEAKQALENLRKEEDELTIKLQLKKQMIEKMAHTEDELSVIKKKISYVNEEKEVELQTLAAERDAIEEIKRQVKMCNKDLEQLKATKSSIMQENLDAKYHLQEAQREMKKIHDQKMQLTKKLAASREDLEESQHLLELCLKHQKESQDAVSSMKNRMLANFMQMRKELRTLQENKMRVSKEINTLKSLNRMGGTLATDEYRVKELVDNLIAEISRATPAEKLQSISNHIPAYFSECLRKNENNASTKGVAKVSTTEGCHTGCDDCPCSARGSSHGCFWAEETSSESTGLDHQEALSTEKQEESIRQNKLKQELPSEIKIERKSEEGILVLDHIKDDLVKISINNQQVPSTVPCSHQTLLEKRDSLQDLFQGAIHGVKDPYPDLKQ